jgi:DNA-binding transcriptional ArsR family regulator
VIVTIFGALADTTRRGVLELLRDGERTAGELADAFDVSRPAVSRHLRVLRDAGLVRWRGDAQRRIYAIEPGPLRELDEWLHPYRRFWADRLDRLDQHLQRRKETNR